MAKETKKSKQVTPELALQRITGCSLTDAALRCKRNESFSKLPELHAASDRDGIQKVLAGEKPAPAKKPATTPTDSK